MDQLTYNIDLEITSPHPYQGQPEKSYGRLVTARRRPYSRYVKSEYIKHICVIKSVTQERPRHILSWAELWGSGSTRVQGRHPMCGTQGKETAVKDNPLILQTCFIRLHPSEFGK